MPQIWKKVCFPLLLICVFLSVLVVSSMSGYRQGTLAGNLLRLHIVGNTDSDSDQKLKLLVRDRILREYRDLFAKADNAEDAAARAEAVTSSMEEAARQTLKRHGCTAPVTVQVEETSFPTKTYGSVSLPAGKYTAVNVRIGKAAGRNWWCVLYPPLCLTEGSVRADEETIALLKETLPPEEYALLTQPDKVTFRMKFKILELLGKIFS